MPEKNGTKNKIIRERENRRVKGVFSKNARGSWLKTQKKKRESVCMCCQQILIYLVVLGARSMEVEEEDLGFGMPEGDAAAVAGEGALLVAMEGELCFRGMEEPEEAGGGEEGEERVSRLGAGIELAGPLGDVRVSLRGEAEEEGMPLEEALLPVALLEEEEVAEAEVEEEAEGIALLVVEEGTERVAVVGEE